MGVGSSVGSSSGRVDSPPVASASVVPSTEVSDAVVVIVSEETGTISVAVGGMLKRHLTARTLERLLKNELSPDKEREDSQGIQKIFNKLTDKQKEADPNEK